MGVEVGNGSGKGLGGEVERDTGEKRGGFTLAGLWFQEGIWGLWRGRPVRSVEGARGGVGGVELGRAEKGPVWKAISRAAEETGCCRSGPPDGGLGFMGLIFRSRRDTHGWDLAIVIQPYANITSVIVAHIRVSQPSVPLKESTMNDVISRRTTSLPAP